MSEGYRRVSMYCKEGHRERHPVGWEKPCKTCGGQLSVDNAPPRVWPGSKRPRNYSSAIVVRRTIGLRQVDVDRLDALTGDGRNVSHVIQEGIELVAKLDAKGKRKPPPVITPSMSEALGVVRRLKTCTADQVAEAVGCVASNARGLLRKLVAAGLVDEVREGRRLFYQVRR